MTQIRSIDYNKEFARFLNAIYATERHFRLENHASGYIFSFIDALSQRVFRDINYRILCQQEGVAQKLAASTWVDWDQRYTGKTITIIGEQVTDYYLSNGYGRCNQNYIHWLKRQKPFDKKLNKKEIRFADVMNQLYEAKLFFRIDVLWDMGFTIAIIDPGIKRSRVEVDEMNCLRYDGLDWSTARDINDLLEIPEKDWIEQFDVDDIVDATERLETYLQLASKSM